MWACLLLLFGHAEAVGIGARQENTTIHLPANPAAFALRLENIFPDLEFTDPVTVVSPPDSTALFVVEEGGVISVITNLYAPTKTVFLDISDRADYGRPSDEGGALGLAFHPGYATNGYFFVYYVCNTVTGGGVGRHDRLSRFTRSRANPWRADPSSEVVLFSQYDEKFNHNGGTVLFGPDGYLYITLGDEGHPDDSFNNAQRIDKDFFSGVMRLDVDHRPGSLPPNPHTSLEGRTNYWIPSDNPFVGATTFNGKPINTNALRAEFWAVGLRSPWRMYWDRPTGNVYVSDVGEEGKVNNHSEEIDLIVKGGNYGWPYYEADATGPKYDEMPAGFSSFPPLITYDRGNSGPYVGRAAIAGVVYRGSQIPSLNGAFIFGDYFSGNIWSLHHSGYSIPGGGWQFLTAEGQGHVVSFGTDPRNGEVLVCDILDDQIKRLVQVDSSEMPPPTLADTGVFSDVATLTPSPGVVPYDINVSFWSDGALKRRWFSIPNVNSRMTYNATAPWRFPVGTVWVKHFDLETVKGDPSTAKRVETRLLVRNASGIYGITYEWDEAGANATLVGGEGKDRVFAVNDGGTIRNQVWHYPSRSECNSCHTPAAGLALGFNTAQLNRTYPYPGGAQNQIIALSRAGYFTNPPRAVSRTALVPASNTRASLEARVKSYLAANCSQCHHPGGSARGIWDARFTTPMARSGVVNGSLANYLGDPNNRVIAPRSPEHSVLLQRISSLEPGMRMPPLATTVLDQEAIQLITQWINTLPVRRVPLSLRLTFPRAIVFRQETIDVRGLASGDNLAKVVYTLNDGPEQEANGVTEWATELTLAPGRNLFTAYAVDGDGKRSRPLRRYFYRR